MFEHTNFDRYGFEDIPKERDIFIVGEKWMKPYESMMLRFFDGAEYEEVGFISWFVAERVSEDTIEMSWIAHNFHRQHRLSVSLPRSEFISCVGCWRCDERPRVFVTDKWLDYIHLRNYSIFALVDAIGVKDRIIKNTLTKDALIALRMRIDQLAGRYPEASFVSFGDSLLIKLNWTVGMFDHDIGYSYSPEVVLTLIYQISQIYRETLSLEVYAVVTQGTNEYYDAQPLHISSTRNHVCINSLGLPFETVFAIDKAAREAAHTSPDSKAALYLDEEYYRSLKLPYGFKSQSHSEMCEYKSAMSQLSRRYIPSDLEKLMTEIKREKLRDTNR